jgi:hypothetical protein
MSAQQKRDGGCPSHYLLDRLSAGELADGARADLERHAATCSGCQLALEARAVERAELTPDLRLLRRLAELDRARRWRGARRWAAVAAPALLCAAGVLLVLRARPPRAPEIPEAAGADGAHEVPRLGTPKGGFSAKVLVEREGMLTELAPGLAPSPVASTMGAGASAPARLHPGDRLQVVVRVPDDRFVAVYSLDAAGTRSRYAPPEWQQGQAPPADPAEAPMVLLPAGGEQPLPNSTILDDVLGPETLAVFACRELHGDAELRGRVTEGEVDGCEVVRFFAVKAAR